jgi:DNA-binding transcriptional ArsR family regulator
METPDALTAFAALSQGTRLQVFRLLLARGACGMLSGEIGQRLAVRANTMSANLTVLRGAGLVRRERRGREMRYFADLTGVRGLMGFLIEDCCGGAPEDCLPVLNVLGRAA